MQFLKDLFDRLTTERVFFYNWEQRAFERRWSLYREQFLVRTDPPPNSLVDSIGIK